MPWFTIFDVTAAGRAGCSDPNVCWMRECMWVGEDKGSYTPGRGYTSYYAKPKPVCMRRHTQGCPYPLPEPDPENARCCYAPTYKGRGKQMTCETCGAKAPRVVTKILNKLPRLPGVPCRHENQKDTMVMGWRECPDCRGFWADRTGVKPHEVPTHSLEDMLDQFRQRLARVRGS